MMTCTSSRGLAIVALAVALGSLQWQTFVFSQDIVISSPHRVTRTATPSVNSTTCFKNSHPSRNDICSLLPVDATASFMWNQGVANRNHGHQTDDSILDDYLLNAFRLLRGVRHVPSHNSWRRLWEDRSTKDRPLQIWMFVNPLDVPPSKCPDSQSCPPTWMQLLNETAAQYCHMLDIEWTVFDWSFATTEFYTQFLTTAQRRKTHGPDVIIHALSRHDLRQANMESKDPHSVLWEEERRRVLQDFVRAGRRANPCRDTVVLFVDDYIPTTTQPSSLSLWVEQVNSRMLHQVSEYYSTGLISYSQVVMELILMGPRYLSLFAPNDSGKFGATAHKAVAQSIMYGLLHFAVTYCNTKDPTTTDVAADVESLVPFDIANRVRTVLPPFLDAEQTLLTVSGEWALQEETEQQFHQRYCTNEDADPPSVCLADFSIGQPLSALGNGESPDDWTLSSEGTLRFSESAQLKWSLGDNEEAKVGLEGGKATICMLLQHTEDIQLTWTVRSQDSSTTGSFSSSNTQNRSPSSSTIAVQMVAQLPDRIGDNLSFHLECSHADSVVDILGFFLCQEENIKRITS